MTTLVHLLGLMASMTCAYDLTGYHTLQPFDDDRMTFYFLVKEEEVTMAMKFPAATTPMWFGMGVSSSGGMIGADMAIATPSAAGEYTIADYWSEGFVAPALDDSQDLTMLESQQDGSTVTVVWKRKLTSCDQQDLIYERGPSFVLFAIGSGPELAYHTHRTSVELHWYKGDTNAQSEAALEKDITTFDFQPHAPFALGPEKTQYKCINIPWSLDQDHHLVKNEPLSVSQYTHHHLYFHCEHDVMEYNELAVEPNVVFDCSVMPPKGCTGLKGWAVGQKTFYYPPQYGAFIPKTVKSFFIQYHLDNAKGTQPAEDQSGVRFYLTPSLRPDTLSTTMLAYFTNHIQIPPGQRAHELTAQLPKDCSERLPYETNIVGVNFHMHALGRFAYLEHWREGKRLPDIAWKHWDFNFQTGTTFDVDQWVKFKPGDSLRLHCIFDTSTQTSVTIGGDGTDNEMCIVFINTSPPADIQQVFYMPKFMQKHTFCNAGSGALSGLQQDVDVSSLSPSGGAPDPSSMNMQMLQYLQSRRSPMDEQFVATGQEDRLDACSVMDADEDVDENGDDNAYNGDDNIGEGNGEGNGGDVGEGNGDDGAETPSINHYSEGSGARRASGWHWEGLGILLTSSLLHFTH